METSPIKVLVADDNAPWRQFVRRTLQANPTWRVIGEASDGSDAVRQAQELQPDLIVIDIGLPTINGIQAARLIQELSPRPRILFLSENQSRDIAEAALSTGAGGYVVKSDAARDLLPAVIAILEGKRFVSSRLAGYLGDGIDPLQRVKTVRHHEVGFYSHGRPFIDHLAEFIGSALRAGNAAIVAATESHRTTLLPSRLRKNSI